jgi:hypothetical protein
VRFFENGMAALDAVDWYMRGEKGESGFGCGVHLYVPGAWGLDRGRMIIEILPTET